MASSAEREAWALDQLAKSVFFHQKLHEWGMMEVAREIERVKGETLEWDQESLGISQAAWNKVIHRGVKEETAPAVSWRLNRIISHLIEGDDQVDAREFDGWRGMAGGSQAQGSWQNTKGERVALLIGGIVRRRLREKGLVSGSSPDQAAVNYWLTVEEIVEGGAKREDFFRLAGI